MDEFEGLVEEKNPDIIGLSEVWLKDQYMLKGYHPVLRHDRAADKKGGGVMLFVKDCFQITECSQLSQIGFEESVWCTIHLSHTAKLLVGVCYRSPKSCKQNNEKLILLIKEAVQMKVKNVIIMGDFNFPHICWDDGYVEGSADCEGAIFFETIQNLYLQQHVNFRTRYRADQTPSTPGLIFPNRGHLVDELEASQPLGKSDHVVITWNCVYEQHEDKKTNESVVRYNFRKGNYVDMSKHLSRKDWSSLTQLNVQEA